MRLPCWFSSRQWNFLPVSHNNPYNAALEAGRKRMRHARRGNGVQSLETLELRRFLTVVDILPQPIAIQTPHINALLRHTVGGAPLMDSNNNFSIDALFNTASPGLLLSNETADFLG